MYLKVRRNDSFREQTNIYIILILYIDYGAKWIALSSIVELQKRVEISPSGTLYASPTLFMYPPQTAIHFDFTRFQSQQH